MIRMRTAYLHSWENKKLMMHARSNKMKKSYLQIITVFA